MYIMPTAKKKVPKEMIILASSTSRPRAGVRNVRGAGNGMRSNVLALSSATSRPRAGPVKTMGKGVPCGCKGKGVRPALDSLIYNSYGKA